MGGFSQHIQKILSLKSKAMNLKFKSPLLLLPVLMLASCYKELHIDFNPKHNQEPVQINFTEPNLFPEGLAYDPHRNWFYVSSVLNKFPALP
jgi:hypothetical protein